MKFILLLKSIGCFLFLGKIWCRRGLLFVLFANIYENMCFIRKLILVLPVLKAYRIECVLYTNVIDFIENE